MRRLPVDMIEGSVFTTNTTGNLRVIKYIASAHVEVEFISTGTRRVAQADHIRRGKVRDKMYPSVYNVGYEGIGKHPIRIEGVRTKAHTVWHSMIFRCYGETLGLGKTYYKDRGVFVVDEWHNFQSFAEWFQANYEIGYELDKDIKADGSNSYGPRTCCFIPHQENSEKAIAKEYIFKSPEGETVRVYNLHKFSKENGLDSSSMCKVHSSAQDNHKQWTKMYVGEVDDE